MSKKRKVQIAAICLLLLAVILLLFSTDWNDKTAVLGFIILVIGTLGSIVSIFIPTDYTFNFIITDWKRNEVENDYFLFIKATKHGIGKSPQVQTFQKNKDIFENVGVSSHHDENGNITISANSPFNGKVIIT